MAIFTYTPDNVVLQTNKWTTLITSMENGVEQRRKKRANKDISWNLSFKNRTQTEMANILAFFDARFGSYDSFTWTNPVDTTSYTVRFDDDSLNIKREAYQIYSFDVVFIKVL